MSCAAWAAVRDLHMQLDAYDDPAFDAILGEVFPEPVVYATPGSVHDYISLGPKRQETAQRRARRVLGPLKLAAEIHRLREQLLCATEATATTRAEAPPRPHVFARHAQLC